MFNNQTKQISAKIFAKVVARSTKERTNAAFIAHRLQYTHSLNKRAMQLLFILGKYREPCRWIHPGERGRCVS